MARLPITADEARREIARAREELRGRKFATGGPIYRNFAEPLETLERFVAETEARRRKVIEPKTLRAACKIWRAIEDRELAEEAKEVAMLGELLFRVEFVEMASIEGTAEQIVAMLRNMPTRPSAAMAAVAYQEIETTLDEQLATYIDPQPGRVGTFTQAEPAHVAKYEPIAEVLPAQPMPTDPAERYEGRNRAD